MNERLWDEHGYGHRRWARSRACELAVACDNSARVCRAGSVCQEMTAPGPLDVRDDVVEHMWRFAAERGGL